jgi:acetyl esterase/lipase
MQILAIDQVSEVSDALTWTMDNIAEYGGDPSRVFLMGHSSGK